MSGVLFSFYHIFLHKFPWANSEDPDQRRRLIWVCTVCLCPKNGTLGLYGLRIKGFMVLLSGMSGSSQNLSSMQGFGPGLAVIRSLGYYGGMNLHCLSFYYESHFHITSTVLNKSKFSQSGIYRTRMKIKQSRIFSSVELYLFLDLCIVNLVIIIPGEPLEPGSYMAYWLCPRCKWPDHFLANSVNIWLNYEGWSKSNWTGFIAPFRKFLDKRWFALINWNLYAVNMPSLKRKCSLNIKLWLYD